MRENFVSPHRDEERRRPVRGGAYPLDDNGEVIHVGQPLAAHHGAQEQTSGMDRSLSLVVRLAPFTVVWLVLSVSVSFAVGMGWAWTFLVFSGLTAITYGMMDKREYSYSRNGLERHKVDTLAELKELEMNQAHELRSKWVDAQIRYLEGGVGDAKAITGSVAGPERRIEDRERNAPG